MDFIDKSLETGKPFFHYIASPHYPLQAPKEDIEKYLGKYDVGWDTIREPFRQAEEARASNDMELPLLPEHMKPWNELTVRSKKGRAFAWLYTQPWWTGLIKV